MGYLRGLFPHLESMFYQSLDLKNIKERILVHRPSSIILVMILILIRLVLLVGLVFVQGQQYKSKSSIFILVEPRKKTRVLYRRWAAHIMFLIFIHSGIEF